MLTIGLSNWAVDLKDVGAIYPFQGFEVPMVIAGIVSWVLWHVWQISSENAEIKKVQAEYDSRRAQSAIDRF